MIIKNKKQLATTKLRKLTLEIIEAGIERVLPINLMQATVKYNARQKTLIVQNKKYDLGQGRIFVIGGGKAAGLMAKELENIIGIDNIAAGIVNCKSSYDKTEKIKVIKASHPVPNQNGVKGVKQMLSLKEKYSISRNDVIICLISGGASALMPHPVDGVSLNDKQKTTRLLLASGAEIKEVNTVRKHLSKIKGGKLGKFFAPTRVVSLIISDVVGNDLATIASGPTAPDSSTFADALKILRKYKLLNKAPKSIITYLEKGKNNKAEEIPKSLKNCKNFIIGDNGLALDTMKEKAKRLGYRPLIITAEQIGNPVKMANIKAKEVISQKYAGYDVIIIGGETTPELPEKCGRGGRNQHYAAVSILAMKKYPGDWVVASVNTDGSDYLPNVAGAIVDNNSLIRAKSRGVDVKKYLARYDSNTLFKKIGRSLIVTGDTGTNAGDVMVYILC